MHRNCISHTLNIQAGVPAKSVKSFEKMPDRQDFMSHAVTINFMIEHHPFKFY
jgi:hypothetical protein